MAAASFFGGLFGKARAQNRTFRDMAEFRDYVMSRMRLTDYISHIAPDAADPAVIRLRVAQFEGTSNLHDVFNRVRAFPDYDPEVTVDEFVASFSRFAQAAGEPTIIPALRTSDYVNESLTRIPDLVHQSYVGELHIVYMADYPNSISQLSQADAPGKSLDDINGTALGNVRKWLDKVAADNNGPFVLYTVDGNDMLSPSLILLDEFWKSVRSRFPGDVLIAIPRRDQLFLFDDTPDGRAIAQRLIDATMADGFAILSDMMYARRNGKIVQLQE